VGSDPSELILAKNGEYAILAAEESSFVTIINTKTYKIVKQIKVDPNPTNVWLGYDQNTVFVENANLKSLNIIDLNSLSVVEYLDFDFTPGYSAFNSKTMEIWVCEKNGKSINIFEKENGKWKKKQSIETELDPHQIIFIENFEKALVINQKSNSLQIINVQSNKIIKKIFTGLKPNGIAIKP
jgi:YVTN family beta-propeller protein